MWKFHLETESSSNIVSWTSADGRMKSHQDKRNQTTLWNERRHLRWSWRRSETWREDSSKFNVNRKVKVSQLWNVKTNSTRQKHQPSENNILLIAPNIQTNQKESWDLLEKKFTTISFEFFSCLNVECVQYGGQMLPNSKTHKCLD